MKNQKRQINEKEYQILKKCIDDGECEEFVQKQYGRIKRCVTKTLLKKKPKSTDADINDLIGDVFVQIFNKNCRKLRQYKKDGGKSVNGWIYMIAYQTVSNHIRKHDIIYDSDSEISENIENNIHASQEEIYSLIQNKELFENTIKNFDKIDKIILKLSLYEGFSSRQIGEIIHMEERSINNRRSKINKLLKEIINPKNQ